ncbi:MAG: hypothetical protein AAF927_03635 [Bacteroidota bacterium]
MTKTIIAYVLCSIFTFTLLLAQENILILGRVVDANTKRGVDSISVNINSIQISETTDSNGYFSFNYPAQEYVNEGRLKFYVHVIIEKHKGYCLFDDEVQITVYNPGEEGQQAKMDNPIELKSSPTWNGIVIDRKDRAISKVQIALPEESIYSDQEGRFSFSLESLSDFPSNKVISIDVVHEKYKTETVSLKSSCTDPRIPPSPIKMKKKFIKRLLSPLGLTSSIGGATVVTISTILLVREVPKNPGQIR